MAVTGKRHEVRVDYEVSVNNHGRITNFEATYLASSGIVADISPFFIQNSILRLDGGYTLSNFSVTGHACQTNISSNVPMRGFGGPEASVVIEAVIDHICQHFKFDPVQVREINMTKEDDLLHYSDNRVQGCTLRECWDLCLKKSNYMKQLQEMQNFNKNSGFTKHGMSIMPMKMAVRFTAKQLMQGLCTLQIYKDGSVLLQTGMEHLKT